jgi:hypothetical protein
MKVRMSGVMGEERNPLVVSKLGAPRRPHSRACANGSVVV